MTWRLTWLFVGFRFLRVRHPKIFICQFQWIWPSILCALVLCINYFIENIGTNVGRIDALINNLNSLMGILFGFYLAQLAIISNFKSSLIDDYYKLVTFKGNPLTPRHYLALMVGYCATLSLCLLIFGFLYEHLTIPLRSVVRYWKLSNYEESTLLIAKHILQGLYVWGVSSLLVVSLLSLRYLIYTVQHPDFHSGDHAVSDSK